MHIKNVKNGISIIMIAFMIALLNSCGKETISIETALPEEIRIDTKVINEEISEEIGEAMNAAQGSLIPSLKIISPKDLELIEGKDVVVKLEAKNFKLVLPGTAVKEGEGHIHVWLDSVEQKGAKTEFIFRPAITGRHSVVAELRDSEHNSLKPRIIESISINVKNPDEGQSDIKHIKVEADDFGFYPSSIKIKKGAVKLNITVRKENVYFNGLDFESKHFRADKVLPGHSAAIKFAAFENFKVTSYWPSTRAKKAELDVVVE